MRKKNFLKFALIFCVALCTVFIFGIYAGAVDIAKLSPNANQPDAFSIEELNIIPNYAVLEGQTLQMQVEEFDEFVLFDSVEWTSSKPDVISCTKNGEIEGLKEGKAIITVKAKVGNASDSITVYCARKLNNPQSSRIALPIAWTTQTPFILHFQTIHFCMFEYLPLIMTEKLEVKGVYGSCFYVEFERSEKQFKGFILQSWMPSKIASDEIFRQLSRYNLEVLVGKEEEEYKVTTNYKGTVKWTVSDDTIIHFDNKTGTVTGLKGGIATISATVGDKTLTCTVHSIYEWPLEWTGAARQATYVSVLKIRAMFENYSLGVLEDTELEEAMEIIHEAKGLYGKRKQTVDKNASKSARKEIKEINLAIERASIIMEDLNKFSSEAGRARLSQAKIDLSKGKLYFYENADEEMRNAKNLSKNTKVEKGIRSDAIKNARTKKESASLIRKYGIENIIAPDESVKEEIQNRDTSGFIESIKARRDLRAYLKAVSVYERAVKPYIDAKSLVEQDENYTHFEELEERYRVLYAQHNG